ncbi:MAG: hypothetical protein K2P63_04905 [Lachnospiraceae bacterium]|nr:hypothetical protein [Lachnospiraceae bacterium]
MRITTKMMQTTSLRNLNINKLHQEKLMNQMSTGKKIMRPSDDPVIAIRSLKLNSSLDKIDQYYEKNASDAESWLGLTLSALSTVNEILTKDVRPNIIQAQSSYMNVKDREAVITHLRNAMAEIYSTGNADSGGRSVFTGYRTDMPLTLTQKKTEYNRITEQFKNDSIDKITHVYAGDINKINEGNFQDVKDITKEEITTNSIYRKRLSYEDIDLKQKVDADGKPVTDADGNPVYESNIDIGFMSDAKFDGDGVSIGTTSVSAYVTIDTTKVPNEAVFTVTDATQNPPVELNVRIPKGKDTANNPQDVVITDEQGNPATLPQGVTLSYGSDGTIKMENTSVEPKETATIGSNVTKGADGKSVVEFDKKFKTSFAIESENIFASGTNDAYMSVVGEGNANKITYIAETGEILFGNAIAERLLGLPADQEMRVTYDKSNWKQHDLDPVHYFYTEREGKTASGKPKMLVYNENFLADPGKDGKQIIEYDVGNNQTLRVNTTADEAFSHGLGRDIEEVISMLEEYDSYQTSLNEVEKLIASKKYEGTDDELKLTRQKEALEEAMTRVGDKINKRTQNLIDDCDGYFAQAQLAETDCGARASRLDMVQSRLEMQQTNFGELVSENEDADYTDLVIQMKSIEMTYQAALSSISYTMQTSLLDFIR